MDCKKLSEENENQYILRICSMKEKNNWTWEDIGKILNDSLGHKYDESAYRKKFQSFNKMMNDNENTIFAEDEYVKKIREERKELEKERKKLQTEKIEYNKWLREEARDEMIRDSIIDEIRNGKKLEPPKRSFYSSNGNRESCLCIADAHYGTEFKIFGLHGEILNEYSPEIFEERMENLLNQVINIIEKEDITSLRVYSLGDELDGILRVGQLMKLRYGIVESSVKYADYFSTWLNTLSNYVHIDYQCTFGNHTELRMLGQPKGTFQNDNTALFIKEIIKTKLEDNQNFNMVENPTGLIFDNVAGLNLLGIHGETKNLSQAIKDFSNTYNTMIDILIGGHMHHLKEECVGIDKDIVSVPSIIGIDDFSMKLNRTSNPGATLFFVEPGRGINLEYRIKL